MGCRVEQKVLKMEGFETVTIGPTTLYRGDCLDIMRRMPDSSLDAVVTDPPYSSGGFTRDDKAADPKDKYQQSQTAKIYPTFSGDSRDQRSYLAWCSLWMYECWRILKPGGYFLCFTDWRQLPVTTDAIQAGGIFWRGIVTWDKGPSARAPRKGYFRHQCEYVVWGTKGKARIAEHDGPFSGCIHNPVKQSEKYHITGKPVELMKELIRCVPPGGTVLDPFCGSGTTGVACAMAGRGFIGIEREAEYCEIAHRRLASAQSPLFAA